MVFITRKPRGGPNIEYFQSPETMREFENVRQWLLENCNEYIHADPPTKESLAKLLIKFIKYQEIKLGVNAVNPKVTRSPMRCLLNFSPGGSLCLTFSAMYRFKCEQNCRNFGFLKDTDTLVSLIIDIEKILIQAGFIRIPIVYIRPEIQSAYTRNLYKEILEKHGAKMTTTEEKATHIIYPLNGQLDGCARPSFRQGKNIMMHWLQFPESNDTWVTDPNDYYNHIRIPEKTDLSQKVWRVYSSWVHGLDDYNEWMVEEDFEMYEDGRRKQNEFNLNYDEITEMKNAYRK